MLETGAARHVIDVISQGEAVSPTSCGTSVPGVNRQIALTENIVRVPRFRDCRQACRRLPRGVRPSRPRRGRAWSAEGCLARLGGYR